MAHVLNGNALLAKMVDAPTAIAVFAYGTLRPGEPLQHIVDALDSDRGQVHGFSLHAYPGPESPFPFMVRDKGGSVAGDLLWCVPNNRLYETIRMEMRAGYDVAIVNVYTDLMEEPIPALAFVMDQAPAFTREIATGDWKDRA